MENMEPSSEIYEMLDVYLDAAPRSAADAVEVGPFTVFRSRGPWSYYARPGMHRSRGHVFLADEVQAVTEYQRDLGLGESIEWVHSLDPSLADACSEAGLETVLRPLLIADANLFSDHRVFVLDRTYSARELEAHDPLIGAHRNVAHVAFTYGGTEVGPEGGDERDSLPVNEINAEWTRLRVAGGHTIAVAAFDASGAMVGVGSAQPVVLPHQGLSAAELTGIAVLPAYRRQGIAAAITGCLGAACATRGVETLLLSAQDDAVARVYERVGFHRVATFAEAAPASDHEAV